MEARSEIAAKCTSQCGKDHDFGRRTRAVLKARTSARRDCPKHTNMRTAVCQERGSHMSLDEKAHRDYDKSSGPRDVVSIDWHRFSKAEGLLEKNLGCVGKP